MTENVASTSFGSVKRNTNLKHVVMPETRCEQQWGGGC